MRFFFATPSRTSVFARFTLMSTISIKHLLEYLQEQGIDLRELFPNTVISTEHGTL